MRRAISVLLSLALVLAGLSAPGAASCGPESASRPASASPHALPCCCGCASGGACRCDAGPRRPLPARGDDREAPARPAPRLPSPLAALAFAADPGDIAMARATQLVFAPPTDGAGFAASSGPVRRHLRLMNVRD